MKIFDIVNYHIYCFYKDRPSDMEVPYAIMGTSTLFTLNTQAFFYALYYFQYNSYTTPIAGKILYLWIFYSAVSIVTLYLNGRYKKVFARYDQTRGDYAGTLFLAYVLLSFFGVLGIVLYIKYKRFGSI